MKNWLKFIGLSFFSDKIAKEAPRRSYGNLILFAVLSIIILFAGYIAGSLVPFRTLYRSSSGLNSVVQSVFVEDKADRINLRIENGVLQAGTTDFSDGKKLDENIDGYVVIVDTRPAGLYDDFTAYCETASGNRITYEEYLDLNDDFKSAYKFKIEYSGEQLVIDQTKTAVYENYLNGVTDSSIISKYEEVKKLTGEEYSNALYELYVKAYYPDLSAYETGGTAPKLRNAYYHNYIKGNKYLLVFDDSIICSFEKNGGTIVSFYGFYTNMGDGEIAPTAKGLEDFFCQSFLGSSSITVYFGFITFMTYIPFVAVVVMLFAFILVCMCKLLKIDGFRYGGAVKILGSFTLISALVASLTTFASGFIFGIQSLLAVCIITFFIVILVRMFAMLIADKIKMKKVEKVQDDTVCG